MKKNGVSCVGDFPAFRWRFQAQWFSRLGAAKSRAYKLIR